MKTYSAAEVALTRLQGQVDQNRHPKTDITLGQAISRWLEIATLQDTTRNRYEDLVRLYIQPVLGDQPPASWMLSSSKACTHDYSAAAAFVAADVLPAMSAVRWVAAQSGRFTTSSALRWNRLSDGVTSALTRRHWRSRLR